jgi:hypothetical protein
VDIFGHQESIHFEFSSLNLLVIGKTFK